MLGAICHSKTEKILQKSEKILTLTEKKVVLGELTAASSHKKEGKSGGTKVFSFHFLEKNDLFEGGGNNGQSKTDFFLGQNDLFLPFLETFLPFKLKTERSTDDFGGKSVGLAA